MTPINPTTNARAILRGLSLAFACSAGCLAYGQTAVTTPPAAAPSAPATLNEDQAVELPKFEISAEAGNRYQSQQALSASRVATAIIDIPQTISVIPKELMEDTKGNRMLDTAKYVTPIQESTLPFGGDRYTIRGFAVSAEFIDGTNISGADGYSTSQNPYNLERLEVIKGPNAILVPGGSPGGVMNPITKAPYGKNEGSVNIDYSPYLGRDVWFDVNRVLTADGKAAARLVAAYWNTEMFPTNNKGEHQYRHGFEVAPSFSYQLSPTAKLTIKGDYMLNRETNFGGLPLDPGVGFQQDAQIARGLRRDYMFQDETDSRKRQTYRLSAELFTTINDHVSSRIFVMADHVWRRDIGGGAAISGAGGGSRNPYTGEYEPGVNWNTSAYSSDTTGTVALTSANAPVTDPSTWTFTRRGGGKLDLEYTEVHFKNDYAAQYAAKWFKSTTIWGMAANVSRVHFQSWPSSATRPDVPASSLNSITYGGYIFAPITPSTGANGTDRLGLQKDMQFFVYETLGFFNERLLVSGGLSRFFGELTRDDTTQTAVLTNPAVLGYSPAFTVSSNASSFGVVVKPIKQVSIFASRNTTGSTLPGSINAGTIVPGLPQAVGSQTEFGVKGSFLGGRLTTSIAHFDIKQQNFGTTNSEYYSLIAAGRYAEAALLPQTLYLDVNSKGWEYEATYSIGKSFTIVGNYADYKARQKETGVRVRGVPDRSVGLFSDYRFTAGALKGFNLNLGFDYKTSVAGENATGYTTGTSLQSKALPNGAHVANQPSFTVPGRMLVNFGLGYKIKNWAFSTTIMNLLDKEYILAAGSRTAVVSGAPRTFKSTVSYKF